MNAYTIFINTNDLFVYSYIIFLISDTLFLIRYILFLQYYTEYLATGCENRATHHQKVVSNIDN